MIFMVCSKCGSENIEIGADVTWNPDTQRFEVVRDYPGDAYCFTCGQGCAVVEIPIF